MLKVAIWLFFLLVLAKTALIQVPPTWVTSNYVQAANVAVINNILTGNSVTPTATFVFGFAFSSVPNLGYGIFGYEGNF